VVVHGNEKIFSDRDQKKGSAVSECLSFALHLKSSTENFMNQYPWFETLETVTLSEYSATASTHQEEQVNLLTCPFPSLKFQGEDPEMSAGTLSAV
jgi:hypothetical protein